MASLMQTHMVTKTHMVSQYIYLGIEILLTYKYGSSTEKAEGRDAFVKKIQWLG